jgi:hypothetical protein
MPRLPHCISSAAGPAQLLCDAKNRVSSPATSYAIIPLGCAKSSARVHPARRYVSNSLRLVKTARKRTGLARELTGVNEHYSFHSPIGPR